ncbi:hypothetical protein JHW43_007615 [Diplocarpon mali]|nr:hypothetical protein JHW43_007615 [Diplocarpon mali]
MTSFQLPPIEDVPSLPVSERASILDALFEPCDALHTLSLDLLNTETFASYNDLIASVGVQLSNLAESSCMSDAKWLDKILGAHPRLGAKKVDSAQSQAEQAQLNTGGEKEAEKLQDLNEEYEKAFPGMTYVVFVNGRSRPVIMENMRSRIDRGDIKLERDEAIRIVRPNSSKHKMCHSSPQEKPPIMPDSKNVVDADPNHVVPTPMQNYKYPKQIPS